MQYCSNMGRQEIWTSASLDQQDYDRELVSLMKKATHDDAVVG